MSELAAGLAGIVVGLFVCWWDRRARNLNGSDDARGGPT